MRGAGASGACSSVTSRTGTAGVASPERGIGAPISAKSTKSAPSAEGSHLADSTAHLARALNRPHDTGLLASAKKRLEESIIRAENEVPLASGLARNLLDILANLGI